MKTNKKMKKLFQTFLIKSKDKDRNFYSATTGNNNFHSSNKSSSILSREKYKSFRFDEVEIDRCYGDSVIGERCSHAEEQKFENEREEPEISSDCPTTLLNSEVSSVKEVQIIKSDFLSNQNLVNSSNMLNNLNGSNRLRNIIEDFQSNNDKLDEEKRKCNSYVISIENSRNFHIGHQTTINAPGSLINSNVKSFEKEIDQLQIEQLLHSQDRLTEDIMKIIAFNFEGEWKNFALHFNLDDESLEELEERFENSTFIIYEILQRFKEESPNASLGFIAGVLRDNYQLNILQKLLKIK